MNKELKTPGPVVGVFPNEVAVIRLAGAILSNTTMAAGDTAEEIDNLRRGGDGHIVVRAASASGGRSCGST